VFAPSLQCCPPHAADEMMIHLCRASLQENCSQIVVRVFPRSLFLGRLPLGAVASAPQPMANPPVFNN
jgi:hypothetical protein